MDEFMAQQYGPIIAFSDNRALYVSKENMTQLWVWESFAAVVTERQSNPAMDFFSSGANKKLTLCNPSVQLYLAQTNSSIHLCPGGGGITGIWQYLIFSFEEMGWSLLPHFLCIYPSVSPNDASLREKHTDH